MGANQFRVTERGSLRAAGPHLTRCHRRPALAGTSNRPPDRHRLEYSSTTESPGVSAEETPRCRWACDGPSQIRYRLERAIKTNEPSSAGRAIGAVGPLVTRVPGDLPVAIFLEGEAVSNVYCVRLPPGQDTCFGGDQPKVRVNRLLAHRDALVQVQLDLQLAPRKGR